MTTSLAHKESDRRLKPTTLRDYGSIIKAHLVPAFGDLAIEDLTTDMVEDWKLTLAMSNTSKIKILTVLWANANAGRPTTKSIRRPTFRNGIRRLSASS